MVWQGAYLHADAHAANGTTATATVRIAQDGEYTVMVRYEALYRFETPFVVTVSQAGKVALERVYGYREGLKVWGYPYGGHPGNCPDLQAECLWPWGSTDNTVWEGYGVGASAKLTAGTATITLSLVDGVPAGVDRASAHFADRNIDAVMLNANTTDLKMRLMYETGEVPFDGLLSQVSRLMASECSFSAASEQSFLAALRRPARCTSSSKTTEPARCKLPCPCCHTLTRCG
eukprot:COSAG06_NODE_344_length_17074_cov_116.626510_2_plen_232_part_00